MKFYNYSFDGEALGGEITILAKNRNDADKLAEKSLKSRYPKLKNPVEYKESIEKAKKKIKDIRKQIEYLAKTKKGE